MERSRFGRREFVIGGFAAGSGLGWGVPPLRSSRRAPNIVAILVDDMRFDEYGAGGHPYLETPHIDALGRSGVTFTQAYHTTPLCSPNRATILTGQYASRHGILDNTSRAHASHELHTFAQELKRAGYETAHVGKWHMGNDPKPRPGYDYWVSFEGQGRSLDPMLYEDGRLHEVSGYVTDIFTERAVRFATTKRNKPFMVFIAHKAIHPDVQQKDDGSVDPREPTRFIPAPRHQGRYAGRVFPRRPNAGADSALAANKPVVANALALKHSLKMAAAAGADVVHRRTPEATIQARAEMMLAVDEGVGRLVQALEEHGLRENTLILFMSDNGYFFDEHGLGVERRLPYEESIRCPFIVSHPLAVEAGRHVKEFALSLDVAPTLVAAAGAAIPRRMQGRSLLPLLDGSVARRAPWRSSFLVEYYGHDNPFPWVVNLDYRAVRFGKHKYIRWIRKDDAEELYDLEADPFERTNLALRSTHEQTLAHARRELAELVLESLGIPVSAAR